MYRIAIHETGHAIFGFADVTTDRGWNGEVLPAAYNHVGMTQMSFSMLPGTFGNPTTPMVLDVLAAQWMFGANTSFHSGDDNYVFSEWTLFSGTVSNLTIWDAGGSDTLSIAGNSLGGVLDLRPGEYSDVGIAVSDYGFPEGVTPLTRTVGIAYGAIIENAIGGSGDDVLIGNIVGNSLSGGSGKRPTQRRQCAGYP